MASWLKNKKSELNSIKQIEKALMNKQPMRAALSRYVTSLNLQGQINRGIITEQQAAQLFQKAIQDFSFRMNQTINNILNHAIKNNQFDQADLSNPLNMQQALANPNSITSQLMDDMAAAVIASCDEESMTNEQMTNQQTIEQQQVIEQQTASENQTAPKPEPTQHKEGEKEKLLVEAVLGVTVGKEILDHTIEKWVGKKIEGKLDLPENLEKKLGLSEEESPFKIPTLKPPAPTFKDEK